MRWRCPIGGVRLDGPSLFGAAWSADQDAIPLLRHSLTESPTSIHTLCPDARCVGSTPELARRTWLAVTSRQLQSGAGSVDPCLQVTEETGHLVAVRASLAQSELATLLQ